MTLSRHLRHLALAVLLSSTAPALIAASPTPQAAATRVFSSPEDAAAALADAVRAMDPNALLAVVGKDSGSWLFSGDPVADRDDWTQFLVAYDIKHAIRLDDARRAYLQVGEGGWLFPAPIIKVGSRWQFDAESGAEEIINRRVGQNELDTIEALRAIVDAQREYAMLDPDGNGLHDYARQFKSNEGRKDGLYWPTESEEPLSPLGELFASAALEGYDATSATREPGAYHGYRYRMLTSQCELAPGGPYSYLVNDKLFAGFAVLAYPIKYGVSGVMSFKVSHEGTVFEQDLGDDTESRAGQISCFNPGDGWRPIIPE